MPIIKCNDINVYYEEHGEGEPLLFLNGLSSDIPKKMAFISAAKKYFKIIIPDIRGVGLTDKPEAPYSISQFADDAFALLEHLAVKKINVAGFSMGGTIAITMALTRPELVNRLILVSTKPAWRRPSTLSAEAERIFHTTDVSEQLLIDLFNVLYGPAYRKRVSAISYVKERLSDKNPQPLHGYLNQLRACEGFDMYDRIAEIFHPTLIVTGKNDILITPDNSVWLHEHIKGSKLVAYDGVGHMVPDEVPKEFAKDIEKFCG
jgi:pimeloyl-ACP methyl ester carboxylesterase